MLTATKLSYFKSQADRSKPTGEIPLENIISAGTRGGIIVISTEGRVYDLVATTPSDSSTASEAEQWQQAIARARDLLPSGSVRAPVESLQPRLTAVEDVQLFMDPDRATEALLRANLTLLEAAKARQRAGGGFAGAEYLFGSRGLQPQSWGINKRQLAAFRREAKAAVADGRIANPFGTDPSHPFYYPPWLFDDPAIGPNMHQVNAGLIKPATESHPQLPGLSYAVQANLASGGLLIRLFFSHAWNEGIFEFIDNALNEWPDELAGDEYGAYICSLCNPQHDAPLKAAMGDGSLDANPFYRVLCSSPAPRVIMMANSNCPIHSRWW